MRQNFKTLPELTNIKKEMYAGLLVIGKQWYTYLYPLRCDWLPFVDELCMHMATYIFFGDFFGKVFLWFHLPYFHHFNDHVVVKKFITLCWTFRNSLGTVMLGIFKLFIDYFVWCMWHFLYKFYSPFHLIFFGFLDAEWNLGWCSFQPNWRFFIKCFRQN
jgi:hypothetical protein